MKNEKKHSRIEIKSEKMKNGTICTKIFVNGNQITGVRSFVLKQDLEAGFPVLTLDINAFDLSLDCPLTKINQLGMGEITKIEFENGIKVGRE